jgi:hypothetical protein
MSSIKSGFLSGFVATYVVVSMLAMNNALKSIPEVHVARTLADILGHADRPAVGWIVLMVAGVFVIGGLYAEFAHRLPLRKSLTKGLALGIVSWLLMMLVFMPLGGAGLFGLGRSPVVPLVTLVLNLVYWVVLAVMYRYLAGPQATQRRGGIET